MGIADLLAGQYLRALTNRLSTLESDLSGLKIRIRRLERNMGKNSEALAKLDEQIADLRAYVESDDQTDAVEVDRRTEAIRQVLVAARGSGEVEPEDANAAEEELAEVLDKANEQTGRSSGSGQR